MALAPRGGQNDDFRPLTFRPGGHGVQGQICDILTPASYESLPAPSDHTVNKLRSINLLLSSMFHIGRTIVYVGA